MNSTGAGAQDSMETPEAAVKMGEVRTARDSDFGRKILEFAKSCEDMKRVGRQVVALHSRIKQEVLGRRLQENQYFFLRNQLTDAMNSGLIDAQLCSTVEKKCEVFVPLLDHFELKLQQGAQILEVWVRLPALNQAGVHWVKSKMLEDPEALRKEIEETKTRVDVEMQFFRKLEEEWNACKENLAKEIAGAIELVGVLMLVIS